MVHKLHYTSHPAESKQESHPAATVTQVNHKVTTRTPSPALAAALERCLGWCTALEKAHGLAGARWRTLRGATVLYDLLEDGPQDTFNDARPLTAFPEAEAVAPAGTCAAFASIDKQPPY